MRDAGIRQTANRIRLPRACDRRQGEHRAALVESTKLTQCLRMEHAGLRRAKAGSHFITIFWSSVAALIAVTFVFFRIERYRSLRFLMWLREQRAHLAAGEVTYNGQPLRRTSELVQYEVCISMCVLYAQFRTSYGVNGRSPLMQGLAVPGASLSASQAFARASRPPSP